MRGLTFYSLAASSGRNTLCFLPPAHFSFSAQAIGNPFC
nr:MAG TPA_asm: hypothetical protein [Caudoviricetes sp.]